MSLRDQLLKAGLVDKKKVQQAQREQKQERKQAQAQREKKAVVEAQKQAERAARLQAEHAGRLEARRARLAEREAVERVRRVDNILRHYALRLRPGPQRFWHRSPCGRYALRLDLAPSVAHDLRAGRLAVAWHGTLEQPEIVVLPREPAERVAELDATRLLFLNEAPPTDPSEALYSPS